jgi:hypothetical protein
MTDAELARKVLRIWRTLRRERAHMPETEIIETVRVELSEEEIARLIMRGLEAIAQEIEDSERPESPSPAV